MATIGRVENGTFCLEIASDNASNVTKIGKDESDDALAHCVHLGTF